MVRINGMVETTEFKTSDSLLKHLRAYGVKVITKKGDRVYKLDPGVPV